MPLKSALDFRVTNNYILPLYMYFIICFQSLDLNWNLELKIWVVGSN